MWNTIISMSKPLAIEDVNETADSYLKHQIAYSIDTGDKVLESYILHWSKYIIIHLLFRQLLF